MEEDKLITLDMTKYGKDGPFSDPVVRCDICQKLIFREQIQKNGGCYCGSRRIRNIGSSGAFTPEEWELMKKKNVDPVFLSLFQEVNENE